MTIGQQRRPDVVVGTGGLTTASGRRCRGARLEPPTRLVVTWQINAQWEYDPDPEHASEIEVLFTDQNGQTKVDFQHRHIEAHHTRAVR